VTPKMTATNENYIDEEIKRRWNANARFHSFQNLLF
jgi:hypothetical protein